MLYSSSFLAMAIGNLSSIGSFSFFFMFPLFIKEHGGGHTDIGLIMGAFTLSSVLCRPWISEMIDRIGRKKSFTTGAIIMSVFPLFYTLFHGSLSSFYLPLLLVRIVHGVGIAICTTAAFTYASDIIPKERLNEGLGMFGVSGLAGMAVGPIVAEFAMGRYGYQAFFLAASGVAVLGLLVHLPLSETHIAPREAKSGSFFSVLKKRRVSTASLLALLFGFGLAGANNFVSPFASERSLTLISIYYTSYSMAAMATRFVGGRLVDRVGEGRVIPYALALTGGGLLSLILLGGNAVLLLSGIMTGCGHGFLYPSLIAMAIRGESGEVRGRITGMYTGSIDAGVFVGSLVLGYIGDCAGFRILFTGAGLALLAGMLVFRIMNPYETRPEVQV